MDQALKEMDNDGLNSLKYSAEVTEYPLFTLIRANLENALWTLHREFTSDEFAALDPMLNELG